MQLKPFVGRRHGGTSVGTAPLSWPCNSVDGVGARGHRTSHGWNAGCSGVCAATSAIAPLANPCACPYANEIHRIHKIHIYTTTGCTIHMIIKNMVDSRQTSQSISIQYTQRP